MENRCEKHSGIALSAERNRRPLDEKMQSLPESQSGTGTHKCAYCAYLLGYDDAKREMQQALADLCPPHAEPEKTEKELFEELSREMDQEDVEDDLP